MSQQLTFGEYIRRRRKELKLSLGDLAKKVEVSYTYMSKIENDQQIPSVITVFRIANALEASVLELSKRLPSDIIERLLEEQAKPAASMQRKSGSPANEEQASRALVENVPKELVTALANFFDLDPHEPDTRELVHCIQALARMEGGVRTALVTVIAGLAEEERFKRYIRKEVEAE